MAMTPIVPEAAAVLVVRQPVALAVLVAAAVAVAVRARVGLVLLVVRTPAGREQLVGLTAVMTRTTLVVAGLSAGRARPAALAWRC